MNVLKSLPVWLCFIPVAILNGGLREYVLVEAIGEEWALPVSGIIFKRVYFPDNLDAIASNDKSLYLQRWLVDWGRLALLTIAFEFAAGLAGGSTVSELLAAYNPLSGNLWLLVLATTLLSPIVMKKCRLA